MNEKHDQKGGGWETEVKNLFKYSFSLIKPQHSQLKHKHK